MDHIVHLGKGRTVLAPQRLFVDTTVARPRKHAKVAARLAALRHVMRERREAPSTSFEPGPLISLRWDQCRYWLGDGAFCGGRAARGKSWCPEHDDVVHGRGRVTE